MMRSEREAVFDTTSLRVNHDKDVVATTSGCNKRVMVGQGCNRWVAQGGNLYRIEKDSTRGG